jgi:peptidoglycan glycosyltransferase
MSFEREIRRILFGLLLGLLVVMGSAAYWASAGPESLLLRDDNPRRVEFLRSIRRGAIYDASQTLLAHSVVDAGRFPVRVYPEPAFFGTIGYYSFRYGTGGVEAFYDDLLSGRDEVLTWERWWRENLLGLPRLGADVRLTMRADLQAAASDALNERRGVIIALDAERGDILALVSRPAYDPNVLDEQWAELSRSPENPFFNRALQGRYQPGSALCLPIVVLGHLGNADFTTLINAADAPLLIDDLLIRCVVEPPASDITLAEALSYGCPSGTVELLKSLDLNAVQSTLASFGLGAVPPVDDTSAMLAEVHISNPQPALTLSDLLGQGQITVNPLAFSRFLTALVNEGAAPSLRLAEAARPAGSDWRLLPRSHRTSSLVTQGAAARAREWLLATGALLGLPETMGGYVAAARSGGETQVWFVGFTSQTPDQMVVLVILENTADVSEALRIGEALMRTYVEASSTP